MPLLILLTLACRNDDKVPLDTTDTGAPVVWDERYDPIVDAAQQDLNGSDALGVAVAVMKGGELVFSAALGTKTLAGDTPLTPQTLMEIGSTSKMLTATALLQKVDAGALTLQATLAEQTPELDLPFGDSEGEITAHQLISHQTSLYDYTPWTGTSDDSGLEDVTFSASGFMGGAWVMAEPGAFWNYSNPNFSLAGLLTQRNDADGRMWPDILEQDLLNPLGLERSTSRASEVLADGDYSHGWGFRVEGDVAVEDEIRPGDNDVAWTRPAGLVWCSVEELALFGQFLLDGDSDVLADDLQSELVSGQVDTLYPDTDYGYGVFVHPGISIGDDWYTTPVWQHGGNTLSFSTTLYALPDEDLVVAIISSGYGTDFGSTLATALDIAMDQEPAGAPEEIKLSPESWSAYGGSYDDAVNVGQIIVSLDGDELAVSAPDLARYGLTVGPYLEPYTNEVFLMDIDGDWYDIAFIDGEVESQFLRNRIFVATRVEDEQQDVAAHTIDVARLRQQLARTPQRERGNRLPAPLR